MKPSVLSLLISSHAIAAVWLLVCSTPTVALANPAGAGAGDKKPAVAGKIDDEILKGVLEEDRLNFLAGKANLVGLTLPFDKAAGFANFFAVGNLASRVATGSEKREVFLTEAPTMLEKRRREVESTFGEKLADAKKLVETPQYRAEYFVITLTEAVRQMHLPAEDSNSRILLSKRLQSLFDDDAKRHGAAPPADRDQTWLRDYISDSEKALFAVLKPEYQTELIRDWPVMFASGDVAAPKSAAPQETNSSIGDKPADSSTK